MPDEREPLLRDLFDATAAHYDWLNHILSLGSGNIYRGQALKRAGLRPGMRVADVACGTGALSERAARLAFAVTALLRRERHGAAPRHVEDLGSAVQELMQAARH